MLYTLAVKNMAVDKIDVLDDPRVEYRNAYINGKNYGMYLTCMECIKCIETHKSRRKFFRGLADKGL